MIFNKHKESDKNDERVNQLRTRIEQAVAHYRPLVADVELTLSFLSGNQWVASSQSKGIIPIENETDEPRDTDNQMLNHFRRWNHYMFQSDPVITAFEGGRELADAERAKVAGSLCDYWEKNSGLRAAREDAAQWCGVAGVGYLVPRWQKDLKRVKRRTLEYVEDGVQDDEGRIRYTQEGEKTETRSDIFVDSYCPLHVHPFPLNARKWSRVEGVLTTDIVTYEWIKNNVDGGGDINEDELREIGDNEVNQQALEKLNRFVSPEFGLMPEPEENDRKYLLTQWFERPTKENPDGKYLLMAGDKIIKDEKLAFVDEAREVDPGDQYNLTMGIIPVFPLSFPGKLIPPAPFGHDMRKAQVRLNDILTDIRQNRKTVGRSKVLYEEGQMEDDAWTDEYGEKIPVKPDSSMAPQVYPGQPLSGSDFEFSLAERSFQQQSGQTSVLQGQNPSQVRAAFHLDILREESMTLMYDCISEQEKAYELTAKLMLAIARRRYSAERIIEIYGRDYMGHALTFATAKIDVDIRVKPGSMKPRNKAVTEAKLVELLQYGAFGQNGENIDQFWEMSELGTMNRAVNHDHKQTLRARNENTMMLRYHEIVIPWEQENHAIHMEEHRGEMARPEWYQADDEVKQIMLSHIEAHREFEMSNLAPETQMPTEPVAGMAPGAAAPGGKGGGGAAAQVQNLEQAAAAAQGGGGTGGGQQPQQPQQQTQ